MANLSDKAKVFGALLTSLVVPACSRQIETAPPADERSLISAINPALSRGLPENVVYRGSDVFVCAQKSDQMYTLSGEVFRPRFLEGPEVSPRVFYVMGNEVGWREAAFLANLIKWSAEEKLAKGGITDPKQALRAAIADAESLVGSPDNEKMLNTKDLHRESLKGMASVLSQCCDKPSLIHPSLRDRLMKIVAKWLESNDPVY